MKRNRKRELDAGEQNSVEIHRRPSCLVIASCILDNMLLQSSAGI